MDDYSFACQLFYAIIFLKISPSGRQETALVPLPCSIRKGGDITSPVYSLLVKSSSAYSLPAFGHKGITWPLCTLKWRRWRPLSSGLSQLRTPPGVPSPSGRATARSPEDSTPGTWPRRLPDYPKLNNVLSVPPEKVTWFRNACGLFSHHAIIQETGI